jgi:PEGA domain
MRPRAALLAAATTLGMWPAAATQAAAEVEAAVVVVDSLSAEGTLEAARSQVPARWRLELIRPLSAPARGSAVDVAGLERAYLDADFMRCLAELQRPALEVDRLLEEGRRAEAAQVGTLAAACALGAGDEVRSREIVRRLLVRELDQTEVLGRTTPDFQRLAEDERQVAQRWGRITVEVRTEPAGASVEVDGTVRCLTSPCRLHLLRGEHVVVTEKLGQRPRALTAMLDGDQTLTVALDLASPEEIRSQLTAALAGGADPSGLEMARAVSTAFGVTLVALVWRHGGQVHANVFQRNGGPLTHLAMDASGPQPAARAIRSALQDWRADTAPRSMFRQPLFWTTAVGVAAVSAAAMFLLYRPLEVHHDILFSR